jgi:hypothetical protein
MAKNGVAVYLRRILCNFCKTATGIATKWEYVKIEFGAGAGAGMGIEWQWLKIVYRGGLWYWRY